MEQELVVEQIEKIVKQETQVLESLTEDVVTMRFNGQKRNIKMLLGHIVDSASNNQQRMVRLQYAPRCGWSMPTASGVVIIHTKK